MALPYAEDEKPKALSDDEKPKALSDDEKPKALSDDEKKKATLNLLLVVIAIDFIVIAAYFSIVLGLGWDPTMALIPLLGISMATGLYFAWQKGKIESG